MHLKDPVEILYLGLMYQWETSAPADGKQGLLDNQPEYNSQISRMVYILRKIGAGTEDRDFNRLARHTRRRDGNSYISSDPTWMENPRELAKGWYFEGGTSMAQKESIIDNLSRLGVSGTFTACVRDFVAGRSVKSYFPTEEEQEEILAKIEKFGPDEHAG